MSKKMASVLIMYGGGLAGLGFLIQQVAPVLGKIAFMAGLAGGGLCLLWGLAALAGLIKGRSWAVLTAIPTAVVLLSQAVHVWMPSPGEGSTTLLGRLLVTVMTVLTVGVLMYLFHGERPPEFYQKGGRHRATPTSSGNADEMRDKGSKR